MNLCYRVACKTRRTMGFALMVALLSLGAISGCGSSNNDSFDFADSGQPDGSDGGLGGEEPAGTWDYAFFYSGGNPPDNPYTDDDLGKTTSATTANGADPSCGAADPTTFKVCVTDDEAQSSYDIKYGSAYAYAEQNNCGATAENIGADGDGAVQLINPPDGKVATLQHGTFGTALPGAICYPGHYDPVLGPDDVSPWPIRKAGYEKMRDDMTAVLLGCGTGTGSDYKKYTTLVKNVDSDTRSCVISTKAFDAAGIRLPDADGEQAVSNGGIAIAWGHGVGHGACGSAAFLQQGTAAGSVPHANPGNTVLLLQLGMRAWSGEWTDTIDYEAGYLRDGSNTPKAQSDSQSCLQPRFRMVSNDEYNRLFAEICGPDGCVIPTPTHHCTGGAICKGQSETWCKAAGPASGCSWQPLSLSTDDTRYPTYGDLALAACAKVAGDLANGGTCGDACKSTPTSAKSESPEDLKTPYDLAKIWTYSTEGMTAVAAQPISGGINSCVGAVAVALGECAASAQNSGMIPNIDTGGCSFLASAGPTSWGGVGSYMAGGLWQQSGPLTTANWEGAGNAVVDGIHYNCDQYKNFTIDKEGRAVCSEADQSCDGFGPKGSDARTPVCQARLTFAKVGGTPASPPGVTPKVAYTGCAQAPDANTIPLCFETPYNQQAGKEYLDLVADLKAEGQNPPTGKGLACWADSLCVTGVAGGGNWPGASPADGQTNSFGHYYKSCGANPVTRVWNPWEGNQFYNGSAAATPSTYSNWTATDNGECLPSTP
ncbi:MAG: hypothetical protein OSA45_17305 [Halioglobus sp.]|nr:hypothetical protein [Halioglobus sp.]